MPSIGASASELFSSFHSWLADSIAPSQTRTLGIVYCCDGETRIYADSANNYAVGENFADNLRHCEVVTFSLDAEQKAVNIRPSTEQLWLAKKAYHTPSFALGRLRDGSDSAPASNEDANEDGSERGT